MHMLTSFFLFFTYVGEFRQLEETALSLKATYQGVTTMPDTITSRLSQHDKVCLKLSNDTL